MNVGRELDALVAEKVMGLNIRPVVHEYGLSPQLKLAPGSINYVGTYTEIPEVPPYSTDIAAAWGVVEKLRERGFGFSLNDGWIAWFLAGRSDWHADAETAPHAICLAALKAVGA